MPNKKSLAFNIARSAAKPHEALPVATRVRIGKTMKIQYKSNIFLVVYVLFIHLFVESKDKPQFWHRHKKQKNS
jgi:hypothetical protein